MLWSSGRERGGVERAHRGVLARTESEVDVLGGRPLVPDEREAAVRPGEAHAPGLLVHQAEPGVRGDTASGGVTKLAVLETGLEIRVPLFIKEGEKVRVHTETREFAGRA